MTMDFTNLVSGRNNPHSIKHWVNHDLIPSEQILVDAEAAIYTSLRVREMTVSATGTLSSAADTISLPARFRGNIQFMWTGANHGYPVFKDLPFVLGQFAYDSAGTRIQAKPRYYALAASAIQFDSQADQSYAYRFDHYAGLAALSESNKTNFLTDTYPRLLRAMCMRFAYEFLKDEQRSLYWAAIAAQEIDKTNRSSDMELAGVDLQMVNV